MLAIVVVVMGLVAGLGFMYHRLNEPDVIVLKPVDAEGNIQSGWVLDRSRSGERIDCSFGSPSPYDKTAGVRSCGGNADSGDACWPANDGAHVLCLVDPFSNVLYLVGAQDLSMPRKSSTEDPTPFALVLDDGTQCRARIGGAWPTQKERPDWVGYYGCGDDGAVWGPQGGGIKKGFGGWTVEIGTEDGPLTTHKVAKVYYVGVATPGGTGSDGRNDDPDGTGLITKCGRTPEMRPLGYRAENGALVVKVEVKARCPSGDIVSTDRLRVTIRDDLGLVCSGVFDFSRDPLVLGGEGSQPTTLELEFGGGTFSRHPNTLGDRSGRQSGSGGVVTEAAASGAEVVDCDDEGTSSGPQSTDNPGATGGRKSTTSAGGSAPDCGSDADTLAALRAQVDADRPFVQANLADRWVAQLSSKRPGLVAPDVDGRVLTWTPCEILQQHLRMRGQYPEVRLVWSDEWRTFDLAGWWVTIAGVTFPDPDAANGWCDARAIPVDECFAKVVSNSRDSRASTKYRG
ncbi:hypothetical protein [Mycobacterium hubeiense]|uniref:hypothetical protein n=1 Tax=Mycobacterium hubeiense TaxID=1867256 RepID=UPI0018EBAEF8|nr:hypothetical protein [Mycobacterium sp. QGD 101]